jgi:hypothetical protein
MNEPYKAYIHTLTDAALADETVQAVIDADALKIEACRARVGHDEFIKLYNKAVDKMTGKR